MTDTMAAAPAEPSANDSPDRPRARVDVAVAGLAAVISTIVALWKVGGPSALGGLWGHWDYTPGYAAAHTAALQAWYTPNYSFGFPFVQDLAHYPTPDYWHLLTLKIDHRQQRVRRAAQAAGQDDDRGAREAHAAGGAHHAVQRARWREGALLPFVHF